MALETSFEHPAPVRVVANAIGQWIDKLGTIWVTGQVAQISRGRGQTVFVTLRDSHADLSLQVICSRVLFDSVNPPIVDGASVVIHAKPDFYLTRGQLQLQARDLRMVGEGELLARLEQRRQLLAAEGLFDPSRKRTVPFLPRSVGLITGANSAAERDVLDNGARRWPDVHFEVAHATMQGVNCVRSVLESLRRLDAAPDVDVIVIARGGGSVEDLLPFSDEALIRAVGEARTPVVSAIGHETDTPLLDYVADVRGSTPTDAAKRIIPDIAEERLRVAEARRRAFRVVDQFIATQSAQLSAVRTRPVLADPRYLVDTRLEESAQLRDRAQRSLWSQLQRSGDEIEQYAARARALSPLQTLKRGYAVVTGPDGSVVLGTDDVAPDSALSIRVSDGRIEATVTDKHATDEDTHG